MLESLFPYILPVHVSVAVALVCLILYTDSYAFSWIRGKRDTLDITRLKRLHHLMWIGLLLMIATGSLMFYPYREYLLAHPPFLTKAGLILTLVVNGFFIGKLLHVAAERPFSSLSVREKTPLFLSGAVSTSAWIGVIIAATMLDL